MEGYFITILITVVAFLCNIHDGAGCIEKRLESCIIDCGGPTVACVLFLYISAEEELLLSLVRRVAQMEGTPIGTSHGDLILSCHYVVLKSA